MSRLNKAKVKQKKKKFKKKEGRKAHYKSLGKYN